MSLSGSGATGGGSVFGGAGNGGNKQDNKPATFGFGTTTSGAPAGGSLFGVAGTPAKTGTSTPLFGGARTSTPTTAPTSGFSFSGGGGTPASGPAVGGGGLFSNNKPAGAPPGGLFGSGASSTLGGNPMGAQPPKPPMFGGGGAATGGGLFVNNTGTSTPTSQPATGGIFGKNISTTPATQTPAGGSLFSGAANSNTVKPGGLFGGATTPATSQMPSAAPSGGLFGGGAGGGATAHASTSAPATSNAAAPPLFGGAKPAESKPSPGGLFGSATPTASATPAGATSAATTSSPTSTAIAPATGGLFGGATPATAPASGGLFGGATASGNLCGGAAATTTPAATGATAATNSGATSGPSGTKATQPPPKSRLKNKSMEEIINRWTSDLEQYKAQFVSQADEIKKYDEVLISNGEKIVNLHTKTQESEKTQARMDTVLQQLENEQEELGVTLDYYETQITNFFEAQFGSAEGMQPADQEREKTYTLAEKLNETLSGMESDLGEMIKAINKAGATINKTSNADDPLSQIVKILNEHLSSLQWIDTHTTQVVEKIQEAQAKKGSSGGDRTNVSMLGGDSDFFPNQSYRSAMR